MKAIWAEKIDSHKVHNSHISLPINGCFSYFIYLGSENIYFPNSSPKTQVSFSSSPTKGGTHVAVG